MSAVLKAIHVGRKSLGLDDDDYRATLERITGKRSAGDMNDNERQAVLTEFRRLGFGATRATMDGPYAGKLVALWLSAWNLGIVRNRTDEALIAFVERQTGIAHVKWLRDARAAARAIEALKAWIAREAGVEWPATQDAAQAKTAVIAAQRRMLGDASARIRDLVSPDATIAALGKQIRKG